MSMRRTCLISVTCDCPLKGLGLYYSLRLRVITMLDIICAIIIIKIILLLLLLLKLYLHTVFSSGFNMQQTKLDKLH